jgi:DNA-binding FadR family transcriptional regulator
MVSHGVDLTGVLRPVREGNAFEETVERLLTVIKLGLIGPGERFPAERELAAQLGISRLTLREAIGELQQAGYVESRRGRFGGTFIRYTPPAPGKGELRRLAREDGDKLADALTFRLAVESGAAETLAQLLAEPDPGPELLAEPDRGSGARPAAGSGARPAAGSGARPAAGSGGEPGSGSSSRSGAQPAAEADQKAGAEPALSSREILLARLADVNGASPQDYRRLDTLFHLSIAELTGSSLLAAACTDARMRLNDLLNAIPVLQRNITHTAGQHAAIVNAILVGDSDRARRAVAEHLDGTGALLRGFLA